MLVNELKPIAFASDVIKEFTVALRGHSEVARVMRDITCSPTNGGFDMEWMVTAEHNKDKRYRTWTLRLFWRENTWVIERVVSEAADGEEMPVYEFDDLLADDNALGNALIGAAKALVAVKLQE